MSNLVLQLSEGLPERTLTAGQPLFDAEDTTSVVILLSGSLRAETGGLLLSVMEEPGTFVGEVGALLALPRSAEVTAVTDSTVRVIGEPAVFFDTYPQLGVELARQLAVRLHRLNAYLSDLRQQYAGSEGHLALVETVLGRLSSRPVREMSPGSDRAPDL